VPAYSKVGKVPIVACVGGEFVAWKAAFVIVPETIAPPVPVQRALLSVTIPAGRASHLVFCFQVPSAPIASVVKRWGKSVVTVSIATATGRPVAIAVAREDSIKLARPAPEVAMRVLPDLCNAGIVNAERRITIAITHSSSTKVNAFCVFMGNVITK